MSKSLADHFVARPFRRPTISSVDHFVGRAIADATPSSANDLLDRTIFGPGFCDVCSRSRTSKSQQSLLAKCFAKRCEARRIKEEEANASSSSSDDDDESSVSASVTSMDAFLAVAREVLPERALARLQRRLVGDQPKRGAKRRLSGSASDAAAAGRSPRVPKRARPAPAAAAGGAAGGAAAASVAAAAVAAMLGERDADATTSSSSSDDEERFEDATEGVTGIVPADSAEEQRQLRLAERLSMIEADPTLAPEEIRRKEEANRIVQQQGGPQAFAMRQEQTAQVAQTSGSAGAAAAASDAAGAAASDAVPTCICCDSRADVHTICDSIKARVTASQPMDMHRAICYGCWNKLNAKQRKTCLQCSTPVVAAFHVNKNGPTTSMRRL